VEGESLLNDAAAIALFGLFLGFVTLGSASPGIEEAIKVIPLLVLGGGVMGWLIARVAVSVMALFARHELAQISISVALPYLAYIGAEQTIGASGVISVVVAGLILNLNAPGRIPPQAWINLREVWNVLAHWAGALIFILAALLIPRLLEKVQIEDFALIGVVILAAMSARAIILFGLLPLMTVLRVSPPVERPYRIVLLWGGLRGAVTLVLALAVTESAQVPDEIKRVVGILATGFTLFTLIIQGSTLRALIARLELNRLSTIEEALSRQLVAVALQTVREDVARTTDNYGLSHDIVRSEAKRFGERLKAVVDRAEDSADTLEQDRVKLGLIALAGHERDTIVGRIRETTISARMAERVMSDADRLIEATRGGGPSGYERAAQQTITYGRAFKSAVFLHNRLRLSLPLSRMMGDRFELLLSQRLILRDLGSFIDRRIRRIHGRNVAAQLHEQLSQRVKAVETALQGLRLQYPGYSEELERRFIRRTALRLEEREYTLMRDDGLVDDEVFTALMQDLTARRVAVEERPSLDISLHWAELVRHFPLFAQIEDAALKRLGRALKTRYVEAGDVIIRKDVPPKGIFFIATGAVELETANQRSTLGRGEVFGEITGLTNKVSRAEVRAITSSTLLVLGETRFRRLLARNGYLKDTLRASADRQGISVSILGRVKDGSS